MLYRIALIIYYLFISKLPNSRYLNVINSIRVWYLRYILNVINDSEGCSIEESVYISSGKDRVTIGKFTQVNENVFIQGAQIGNYVMIAPNVAILSSSHNHTSLDLPMVLQGKTENMPVIINDDVWIGRNAIIMPGCEIGIGAIIGAGAVVTKSIPAYGVAVGTPARVIKYRK